MNNRNISKIDTTVKKGGVKKRTIMYSTLKGLINKNQFNQFTLSNFISMRMYHKTNGWVDLRLSNELYKKVCDLFKGYLGLNYMSLHSNYGIFERLIIDKRLKVEYIAGQDYPTEIRELRRLLR